jgi:tetratricopeptide (TPR) repeat protein
VCWLAAGLLPSSSIVALKEMDVDHRAYLGGAGALFAVASFVLRAGRGRWLVAWGVVLSLVALRYEWVLMDPVRAWSDAVRRAPDSAEAVRGLGEAHAQHGDSQDAERELQHALALDESDPRAWTNLGAIWLETGRRAEAMEAFRRAAELAPRDARIRDNLAMVLRASGDIDGAVGRAGGGDRRPAPAAQPRITLASILIDRREYRGRGALDEVRRMPRDAEDEAYCDKVPAKLYEYER